MRVVQEKKIKKRAVGRFCLFKKSTDCSVKYSVIEIRSSETVRIILQEDILRNRTVKGLDMVK